MLEEEIHLTNSSFPSVNYTIADSNATIKAMKDIAISGANIMGDAVMTGAASYGSANSFGQALERLNESPNGSIKISQTKKIFARDWLTAASDAPFERTDRSVAINILLKARGSNFAASFRSAKDNSWLVDTDGVYKVKHGSLRQKTHQLPHYAFMDGYGEFYTNSYYLRYLIISGSDYKWYDVQEDRVANVDDYLTRIIDPKTIDASVRIKKYIYIFCGDHYYKFDTILNHIYLSSDPVDAMSNMSLYPKSTKKNWDGLPFDKIDAAFAYGNKLYFFRGDEYLRFNLSSSKIDVGPKKFSIEWEGIPFKSIDGICRCRDKVYFFSGNQYVRYDMLSDKVDKDYPYTISESNWPGLGFKNITAIL